jgi:malic enzyme
MARDRLVFVMASAFNKHVVQAVATAVVKAAQESGVARRHPRGVELET